PPRTDPGGRGQARTSSSATTPDGPPRPARSHARPPGRAPGVPGQRGGGEGSAWRAWPGKGPRCDAKRPDRLKHLGGRLLVERPSAGPAENSMNRHVFAAFRGDGARRSPPAAARGVQGRKSTNIRPYRIIVERWPSSVR